MSRAKYEGRHRWAPGVATSETVAKSARSEAPEPLPTWGGRPGDPGLADAATGQLERVDEQDGDGDDEPAESIWAAPTPGAPADKAYFLNTFMRGVRQGRRAAAAEGVTAERFGLPLSGRGPERSTAALAERYGDEIWQGGEQAPLDRSGDDVRRPWM